MALQLIEGFDHMSTVAKLAAKGWAYTAPAVGSPNLASLVTGRINGQAFRTTCSSNSNASPSIMTKTLPAAYTTAVAGFAFRVSGIPTAFDFYTLRAGATNTVRVLLSATGLIQIFNSGGTLIGTGTHPILTNAWNYIEIKAFMNGASGTIDAKLNGATEIATTTGNFGSTGVDNIVLRAPQDGTFNGVTFDWDDLYLLDTSGTDNTTFLGDAHVETIYPAAGGGTTQWTPDTGSNFARVNEHAGTFPDDDTSYVSSSTAGQRDSYDMDTLAILSGSIFGVQVNMHARKDDAATREIASVVRVAGVNYDGTTQALGTTYSDKTQIIENDPSDGADWTVSKVNAAEFGHKLVT